MEAVKTAVWFGLEICIPPWIEGSSGLPDLPWFGNAIFGKSYAVTAIVYLVPLSHAGWAPINCGFFVHEGFASGVT